MSLFQVSRRQLLGLGLLGTGLGAAALVLGLRWRRRRKQMWRKTIARPHPLAPSAFLALAEDGTVIVYLFKLEKGQGVYTAYPIIIAEHLDADLTRVRVESATVDPAYGGMLTGVSSSVRDHYLNLAHAAAAARQMLIKAAARQWGVSATECETEPHKVVHRATQKEANYGALAALAASESVPDSPELRTPNQFRNLGKAVHRLDTGAKVDGSAIYGIDVRVPGMLHATVVRCPVFGGKLKSLDATESKAIPGVRDVFEIPTGVAVVGDTTWHCFEGAARLQLTWDEGPAATFSSEAFATELAQLLDTDGYVYRSAGQLDPNPTVQADYHLPFLAHATMEPPNATVDVRATEAELWLPTQDPEKVVREAAPLLGLPPAAIKVHMTFAGCGFGRRVETDEVIDALHISKRLQKPVKVTWPRQQDIQHDWYRPMSAHRLKATLGADGYPTSYQHKIALHGILARVPNFPDPVDPTSVEGAYEFPYHIPNLSLAAIKAQSPMPLGFWRSVGHSHNAFVIETFIDTLASAAQKDPWEYRKKLLANAPRHLAVLNLAAEKSGWGGPLPQGHARGLAVHESFGSFVAQVAEVSLIDGFPKIHRVTVAVDCGQPINLVGIQQQAEGGVIFGLTAFFYGQITVQNGRVQNSNFHDYRLLSLPQSPQIDVHVVESHAPPGGMGEVAVPPIAPAVANALFQLTGKRIQQLPFKV